jgi:hypothetical protein
MYLVRYHTHLSADHIHAAIEKAQRKRRIGNFNKLMQIVGSALKP